MKIKLTILAAVSAATLVAAGPASADKFVYGSWFGVSHSVNQKGLAPYFEKLAEKTDGKVEWDLVPGAQLASGPGTPEAVGNGLMDGGIAIAPYQPSLLPATNAIFSNSLPGDDALAAAGAMNEAVMLGCPQCQEEYHDLNAVGFGGYATTPYLFMCRGDVQSVDDMKGLKVRSSGGGVNITEIAGGTPVSMSPADATTALERGTLDCVLGAVSWLRSYGYMDVTQTVVDSPMGMGGPPLLMFLNRDTWDSMTPEMRAAHIELAPDLVAGATYDGQVEVDKEIVAAAKEAGVNFVDGGEGFADLMAKHVDAQHENIMKNAGDTGVENAEELISNYEAAYEKWQKLLDDEGRDKETFSRLLWEQVYSKVDPENL